MRAHLPSARPSLRPRYAGLMMMRQRRSKMSGFRCATHMRRPSGRIFALVTWQLSDNPCLANEYGGEASTGVGAQNSCGVESCALPVTARKLAASALRTNLGVFLAGMKYIDNGDGVNSNAIDHQVIRVDHRFTGAINTPWAI